MRLTPPKKIVFWISVVLGLLGLVAYFIPAVSVAAFWVLLIGFALLVAGLIFKGF